MDRRGTLGVLVVVLAVGGGMASVGGASGPGPVLCAVCGTLDDAAADNGVDVTVERSELAVLVHENGTGRVTAQVEVNESDADRLREDPATLDRIVADAYGNFSDYYGGQPVLTPDDPSVRVEGDTVVVSYRVEGVAEREIGGVLVVDLFHAGRRGWYYHSLADRVVVRGPEGYGVANRPPGATVSGRDAVWGAGEGSYSKSSVPDHTYVALAPDSRVGSPVLAQAAIAGEAIPVALAGVVKVATFPVLVLLVVTGSLVGVGRREYLPDWLPGTAVGVTALLATLLAVANHLNGAFPPYPSTALTAAVFGMAVVAVASVDGRVFESDDLPAVVPRSTTGRVAAGVVLSGVAVLAPCVGLGLDDPDAGLFLGTLVPAAAAYTAFGVVVAALRWRAPLAGYGALLPVPVALAVGLVVGVATGGIAPRTVGDAVRTLGYGLPPFLFFPLGVAARRASPGRWPLAAAVLGGPVLVGAVRVPVGAPYLISLPGFLLIFGWMVLFGFFVLPLFVLGWIVADEARSRPESGGRRNPSRPGSEDELPG